MNVAAAMAPSVAAYTSLIDNRREAAATTRKYSTTSGLCGPAVLSTRRRAVIIARSQATAAYFSAGGAQRRDRQTYRANTASAQAAAMQVTFALYAPLSVASFVRTKT